jgi:hypothetical protein
MSRRNESKERVMGKILQFPHQAPWPPLPLRRPVPLVRFTYVLDRDYPPGHPLHEAVTVTVTDAGTLLNPALPQPASGRLYDLVARHHNRQPHDWIVLGQLTKELEARGLDWQQIGLDPVRVCRGLTRLCAAGWLGLVAEQPNPTGLIARRLVAYQAGDPAMTRHAPGWLAAQQAEDEANLAAYLQAHPETRAEAAAPAPTTAREPGPQVAGEDSDGRDWCPSWADDDAGYADEWTDEDEALAVAEANALYEREQAEQWTHTATTRRDHPYRLIGTGTGTHGRETGTSAGTGGTDGPAGFQEQPPHRPRWWFHAVCWLVIIALTVGTYRLVS